MKRHEFRLPLWDPRNHAPFPQHGHCSWPRPRPPPLLSESLLLPSHLQPPSMFGPRGATVPPRFHHQNMHQRSAHNSYSQLGTQNDGHHWCETCDRGFKSSALLEDHKSQHQKCNIDGCQFVAHPKVITKHIQMQHSSGLYNKISKLTDPEEIKKWREERRMKFPTRANIDKKNSAVKEKIERGERMGLQKRTFPDNSKHQRNNFGPRKRPVAPRRKPKLRKVENACPESKPKHNLPAFTGINQLNMEGDSEEETILNVSNFEIEDEMDLPEDRGDKPDAGKKTVCGAITNLIENYGSSDEDDCFVSKDVMKKDHIQENQNKQKEKRTHSHGNVVKNNISTDRKNTMNDGSDESGPEEIKTVKITEAIESTTDTSGAPENLTCSKPVKKIIPAKETRKITKINMTRKLPSTLLEKLLSNEIRHERNVTLQCIRYIVNNNYFKKL